MTFDYPGKMIPSYIVDVVREGMGPQGCWTVRPKKINLDRIVREAMNKLPQLT